MTMSVSTNTDTNMNMNTNTNANTNTYTSVNTNMNTKSDLEKAREKLGEGHTIALCKDDSLIVSDERGIAPMLGFMRDGRDLRGYSVADKIVGRAAAMLFVKAGIVSVYAATLSVGAKALLEHHGIPVEYSVLTEKIINRKGDGICPMEKAVANISDDEINVGVRALLDKAQN